MLLTRRSVKRMIDVICKPSCKSPVIQAVLKNRQFFFVLVQSFRPIFTARTVDNNELGQSFNLLITQQVFSTKCGRWEQVTGNNRREVVLLELRFPLKYLGAVKVYKEF